MWLIRKGITKERIFIPGNSQTVIITTYLGFCREIYGRARLGELWSPKLKKSSIVK